MKPVRYRSINATQSYRCRGIYQQTSTGLLNLISTGKSIYGGPDALGGGIVTSAPESGTIKTSVTGFSFGFVQLTVRNNVTQANAMVAGLGVRVQNDLWQAGSWTNATSTYARLPNFQTSTGTAALSTTAANDGFVVWSSVPFNLLSFNITTAEAGLAVTHDFAYTAPAGWSTQPLAQMTATDWSATAGAVVPAGEALLMFDPPSDWVQTGSQSAFSGGYGTGVPNGMYGVRVRTPAGPTTAAVAIGLEIGLIAIQSPGAGPNSGGLYTAGAGSYALTAMYAPILSSAETQIPYGDAIIAVFSGFTQSTPAIGFGNSIDCSFRVGVD
jgi:hypothetical protein